MNTMLEHETNQYKIAREEMLEVIKLVQVFGAKENYTKDPVCAFGYHPAGGLAK